MRSCPACRPSLLILIPAILMAVSIVREKELGSIINFYVTPTRRIEFLVGKQLPYIVIGMINYAVLVLMAVVVFGVPLKGSGWMLTLCTLLYVTATTALGMLVADVHVQPGGGRLHHGDPHDPADNAVLGAAPAGLHPGRRRPGVRHAVANHVLHARQCRRLHQGPGGRRPLDGRPRPGRVYTNPHRIRRCGPATARRLSMGRALQHFLARSEGAAQPGERSGARCVHPVRLFSVDITQARGSSPR